MQAVFKRLATVTVPPDGAPHALYTPPEGGCAVVGKITIVSRWPTAETEGYLPVPGTDQRRTKLVKDGRFYDFGPGFTDNHGRAGWVLTGGKPHGSQGGRLPPELALFWIQEGGSAATRSLFKLFVQGQPVSGLLAAPMPPKSLALTPGFTLGEGESLSCTNGVLPVPLYLSQGGGEGLSLQGSTQDHWLTDYRKRTSSLVFSLFGQEFKG